MPVLGVVVTHPDPVVLLPALRAAPGVVTVGAPGATRVPLVIEFSESRGDTPLLDALQSLPGVLAVDIAFADFSDLHAPTDG